MRMRTSDISDYTGRTTGASLLALVFGQCSPLESGSSHFVRGSGCSLVSGGLAIARGGQVVMISMSPAIQEGTSKWTSGALSGGGYSGPRS